MRALDRVAAATAPLRRRRGLRRGRPRPAQRGCGHRRREGARGLPQGAAARTTACSTSGAGSCPGRGDSPLFLIGGVRVGVAICEDAWSPTGPVARLAAGGAELVVSLNASPYRAGVLAEREAMLADPRGGRLVRARLRQPRRRPGRARLRRRLDGLRPRGRAHRLGAAVRRVGRRRGRRRAPGLPQADRRAARARRSDAPARRPRLRPPPRPRPGTGARPRSPGGSTRSPRSTRRSSSRRATT